MVTAGCESGGLPLRTCKNAGKGTRQPQTMPLLIPAELRYHDLSAMYTQLTNPRGCTGNLRSKVQGTFLYYARAKSAMIGYSWLSNAYNTPAPKTADSLHRFVLNVIEALDAATQIFLLELCEIQEL